MAGLIADAAGDLFGTTYQGGADDDGTVFEIAKTPDGYASAPTTLVSVTGVDRAALQGSLIADAAGDLFGTTSAGGAAGDGTVFEIAKTGDGYASVPTNLASFNLHYGTGPSGSLVADAAGDLFGAAASGGNDNLGTVFEIINSGYVTQQPGGPVHSAAAGISYSSARGAAFVQAMASHGASRFGSGGAEILASRNDTPMLVSTPHAAY